MFDVNKFVKRLDFHLDKKWKEEGISASSIAEDAGITRSTLSKYRNGKALPPPAVVVELARALGVSTDYLLCVTDATPSDLGERQVCEATNLSVDALNGLRRLTNQMTQADMENGDVLDQWLALRADEFDVILPMERPTGKLCQHESENAETLGGHTTVKVGEIELPRVDEADVKLMEASSKARLYSYLNMTPSRRTIINEMLASEEIDDLVDSFRAGIASIVTAELHRMFADIHQYPNCCMDMYIDEDRVDSKKRRIERETTAFIERLAKKYLESNAKTVEAKMREYSEMIFADNEAAKI